MERLRFYHLAAELSVQVKVPGLRMAQLDGGRPVLTARAVVGMPSRPTPLFDDRITHLVFNPTWTVPQSIARKDLPPRIAPRSGLPASDEHGRLDSYSTVHAPGLVNPLGRVKFKCPNR